MKPFLPIPAGKRRERLLLYPRAMDRENFDTGSCSLDVPSELAAEFARSAVECLKARFTWRADLLSVTQIVSARNQQFRQKVQSVKRCDSRNQLRAGRWQPRHFGLKSRVVWHLHDLLPFIHSAADSCRAFFAANADAAVSQSVADNFAGAFL